MKEHPILFSATMVKAILDGRKTQTRRAVKLREFQASTTPGYDFIFRDRRMLWNDYRTSDLISKMCPYGMPGDRLWVREAWAPSLRGHGLDGWKNLIRFSDGVEIEVPKEHEQWFDARTDFGYSWRPSIHMPRWASRILLEVTEVRIERLQGISEADAEAEGCSEIEFRTVVMRPDGGPDYHIPASLRGAYANLWTKINGPGSWDANPWVWVISFKRIEK